MELSFRTKLLATHLGLVAAIELVTVVILDRALGADLVARLEDRVEEQARGAAPWVANGRHLDKLAARLAPVVGARVTLFREDGAIEADSSRPRGRPAPEDAGEGKRPEVQGAIAGGIGRDRRWSAHEGAETLFVAAPMPDGGVVRLAAPLTEIQGTLGLLRKRLLLATLIALVAATGLALLIARALGIAELTRERDRLNAILTGMVEGVLVLAPGGEVVLANPSAAGMLGKDLPLSGRGLGDAVPDPSVRAVLERGLGGEVVEAEVTTRGGSVVMSTRPMPQPAGGVVCVLHDVTRLRKLEVVRRDFVANVSHELRTPVTAIQGFAETLLRGGLDEKTRAEFMEVIHRHAVRIGRLVEDLLQLAAIESRPPGDVRREPIEVLAVARHVARTVKGRADARGVTIEVTGDDTSALGDAESLEQVLENLADNAIKYGREGGRIAIAASRADGRVRLVVKDDGPGIAPEHLGRIFERFYRVDPGRSRAEGGTGLGLAISKHLVEAMDGNITATSAPGEGLTLTVDLPASPARAG